jgi:hypothetical protein
LMVCPYLSYLKQSLEQTLLYKILSHPKNHSFFLQLLKNTFNTYLYPFQLFTL